MGERATATVFSIVVGGLAAATNFYPPLDRIICWVLAGACGLWLLSVAVWWFVGEALFDLDLRRPAKGVAAPVEKEPTS